VPQADPLDLNNEQQFMQGPGGSAKPPAPSKLKLADNAALAQTKQGHF
jgi:hypothetical protein